MSPVDVDGSVVELEPVDELVDVSDEPVDGVDDEPSPDPEPDVVVAAPLEVSLDGVVTALSPPSPGAVVEFEADDWLLALLFDAALELEGRANGTGTGTVAPAFEDVDEDFADEFAAVDFELVEVADPS